MAIKRSEPPLFVDLDGTLVATDVSWETILAAIRASPLNVFRVLFWSFRGKPYLKDRLVPWSAIDPTNLPYNEEVVQFLVGEHAQGRTIILASASHVLPVGRVAQHVGMFARVLATDGPPNLKGEAKLEAIRAFIGERGEFDYAGDSSADLAVWGPARKALLVQPSARVRRAAERLGNVDRVFTGPRTGLSALVGALHVRRWAKNLLLFLPALLLPFKAWGPALAAAFPAFLVFCLVSSAVYLMNDLSDLDYDRRHPDKRGRPLASGRLPLRTGLLLAPVLLLIAFAVALWTTPPLFLAFPVLYLVVTALYSWRLKRTPVADLFTLAGLSLIRIVAGVAAIQIPLSAWFLAAAALFFVGLAAARRYGEASTLERLGDPPAPQGGYVRSDLPFVEMFGIASGLAGILLMMLHPLVHPHSSVVATVPPVVAVLLLSGWFGHIWFSTHRGRLTEDALSFATGDKTSYLIFLLLLATLLISARM